MAKTSLRFYRGNEAPKTPTTGMVWFDTAVNVIKVYTGSDWEKYGKVQDVTFENLVLKVTKSDGSTFSLDFTDVASATQTGATFEKLTTRLTQIEQEIDVYEYDGTTYSKKEKNELVKTLNDKEKKLVLHKYPELVKEIEDLKLVLKKYYANEIHDDLFKYELLK